LFWTGKGSSGLLENETQEQDPGLHRQFYAKVLYHNDNQSQGTFAEKIHERVAEINPRRT
jgi:hypothetical protein